MSSLREDQRELKGDKVWKTIWERGRNQGDEVDQVRPKTSINEVKPVHYTLLNTRNMFNQLFSTDPKPEWRNKLD